jgi:hypothetical protein
MTRLPNGTPIKRGSGNNMAISLTDTFSSSDIAKLAALRSMLDRDKIAYEVRNETLPWPGAVFHPELWIMNEEDFPRACELRDSLHELMKPCQKSWTCLSCGEENDEEFTFCVSCPTERKLGSRKTKLYQMILSSFAGVAFAALAIKALIHITQGGLHSSERYGFHSASFTFKALLVGLICGFACIWRALSLWRKRS